MRSKKRSGYKFIKKKKKDYRKVGDEKNGILVLEKFTRYFNLRKKIGGHLIWSKMNKRRKGN